MAQACQREKRKEAARSQKISKEVVPRAKKMAREVFLIFRDCYSTFITFMKLNMLKAYLIQRVALQGKTVRKILRYNVIS